MELSELNDKELVALVVLLDEVIAADRDVTDEEVPQLAKVVAAVGEDAYARAVERADREIDKGYDLQAILTSVPREEAREIIYATVEEVAMANAITPQEAPLLETLRRAWRIEEKVIPPSPSRRS